MGQEYMFACLPVQQLPTPQPGLANSGLGAAATVPADAARTVTWYAHDDRDTRSEISCNPVIWREN